MQCRLVNGMYIVEIRKKVASETLEENGFQKHECFAQAFYRPFDIYSKDSVKSLNLIMPATKRVVAVARGLVTAAIWPSSKRNFTHRMGCLNSRCKAIDFSNGDSIGLESYTDHQSAGLESLC